MNRQRLVLAVLLVVFAGSLVYSFIRSPRQREAAPHPVPRKTATVKALPTPAPAARPADDKSVHLELLDRQQARFSGFRRNIFSPIFREEVKTPPFRPLPPPPRPLRPLPPPPPFKQAQVPQAPPPPPPPTPEQIADQELAKFTFLGFLKRNGEKTVFLSSNNEIFLAKKGSKLGNSFVVSDLTDDAITVKSLPGGREIVIPLLDNRALRRTSKRTP